MYILFVLSRKETERMQGIDWGVNKETEFFLRHSVK